MSSDHELYHAMPMLRNARQEKFCRELVKGKPQYKAYLDAGYQPSKEQYAMEAASVMLSSNSKVQERVAELQEKAAVKLEITQEWLIERANHAYEVAEKLGQTATLVAAVKEIGILSGKRIERQERDKAGEFAKLSDMSPDDLLAYVLKRANEEGLELEPEPKDSKVA